LKVKAARPAAKSRFKVDLPRHGVHLDSVEHEPVDIQPIGAELAIKWEDAAKASSRLKNSAGHCPCAALQRGNGRDGPRLQGA